MDPITIAAFGMTAVNSYIGARQAAARRRDFIDEQSRRLRLEHDRTISLAQASGAASGIEFDSKSLQTALSTMTNEFRWQESLFKSTGYQEASDITQAGGWNAFGDIVGGILASGRKPA